MSKKSRANAAKASETPEVIIENSPLTMPEDAGKPEAAIDEAPVELPAEDQPLEVINEEIAAPAPTGLLKVIVTTSSKSHGTPGSKSTVTNPIPKEVLDAVKAANLNTCNSVKTLFANGFTRAQIVAAGYNASTVYRQVKEYEDGKGVTNNAAEAFEKAAIAVDEKTENIDENAGKLETAETEV